MTEQINISFDLVSLRLSACCLLRWIYT